MKSAYSKWMGFFFLSRSSAVWYVTTDNPKSSHEGEKNQMGESKENYHAIGIEISLVGRQADSSPWSLQDPS